MEKLNKKIIEEKTKIEEDNKNIKK